GSRPWSRRRIMPPPRGNRFHDAPRHPRCRDTDMHIPSPLAFALLLAVGGAHAGDRWQTSGDIRFGYVSSETRARSGAVSDADSFRARARLRASGELGSGWHASGRVAARLDTDQS